MSCPNRRLLLPAVALALICSMLSVAVAADPKPADEAPLVIRNIMLFDSTTGTMRPAQTIVILGDRIQDVVPVAQASQLPEGATILDGSGKFAIPGLIDAHVHLVHLADRTFITGDEFLPMFLAAGVTSVRSAGDAIVAESGVSRYAAAHPDLCPRVILASPLIDGDPPYHRDVGYALTDPEKVAAFVDDMAKWHVATLKIYVGTDRAIGAKVIAEGHRHKMKVTGHLGRYSAQDAAADGIDCLEHIWSVFNYSIPGDVAKQPDHRANLDLNNPQCQALVELLANRKVSVDATLVVFKNMIYLNDLEEVHKHPDLAHVPKRMLKYWETYRIGSALKPETRPNRLKEIQKYQELTGKLHRMGVQILVGTDTPEPFVPPGFSMHQEMELLVQSGMTPAEVLAAASLANARIVQRDKEVGSIEKGKFADIVILSADPTADIRNSRKIENVIRGGIITTPAVVLKSVPAE